jgi:hypothetical protein
MADRAVEAVRQRLLLGQNLNWWKGDKTRLSPANINELRNDFNIFYNPHSKRFSNLRKSRRMPCTKCNDMGKLCTGVAPAMCPQCAIAGYSREDCVYLDKPLELSVAAGGRGQVAAGGGGAGGAANAPIQPAVPNRGGAGLAAIRRPLGRGSPTGMEYGENENEENENEENEVNSNDPNATEAEIAAGRAKRQARINAVRNLAAASALDNMASGNRSAKAVRAMAAAAGAGGKRKRKSRKQTLKRKQKFTRKQK